MSENTSTDGGEQRECYNPLCEEPVTCDPETNEAYCGWDCAVTARSGAADRILRGNP